MTQKADRRRLVERGLFGHIGVQRCLCDPRLFYPGNYYPAGFWRPNRALRAEGFYAVSLMEPQKFGWASDPDRLGTQWQVPAGRDNPAHLLACTVYSLDARLFDERVHRTTVHV